MPRRIISPGRCCLECRRRKIKCDRAFPCAYCTRSEIQCQYPPKKSGSDRTISDPSADASRIDGVIQTLAILEEQVAQINRHLQPCEYEPQPSLGPRRGLEPSSAARDILAPTDEDFPYRNSLSRLPFTPNSTASTSDIKHLHPPAATIILLWQMYLETVDPVLKLFHVPTVQKSIMEAVQDLSKIDASTEITLFAIYYATLIATSAEQCQVRFMTSKEEMLPRFRDGIEKLLLNANLFTSQDLIVLQVLVLFITCGRRDDKGLDIPSLTGIAIGFAMRLGLHCTESMSNLSPFELEMRRRVWWQISTLDARVAEDYSAEPMIMPNICNTAFPSNVNDANLNPSMSQAPHEFLGRTEMLYSLVRFQGSHFSREVVFSDDINRKNGYDILTASEKCDKIDKYWEKLETQYLCYCDVNLPIDSVTISSIRLIVVKWKLAVTKPRPHEKQDTSMRTSYRETCQEVLHHALSLRQYKEGHQWLWLFQTYVEWDALAYLLLDLCLSPAEQGTDATWTIIDDIYQYWKDCTDVHKDGRWENIEGLRRAALQNREHHPSQGAEQRQTRSSTRPLVTNEQPLGISTTQQISDPTLLTDQIDILWTQANETLPQASLETIAAATEPSDDMIHLPSTNTACEWSDFLFDRYWQAVR